MTIRVLLADDQDLVRVGLRIILESEDGVEVVGEARTGREAVTLARTLHPDVICMDVQMPELDGLAATRELVAAGTTAGILILTTFNRDDYLFDALEAGASGFVLKNSSPEDLVAAVQVIARGDALLSPDVTRRVIEGFAGRPRPTEPSTATGSLPITPSPALGDLTEREREVLGHLALGLSNTEIAGTLYLGEATVKTHVSKILQKLGLRDRIQAVVFAYENGVAVPGHGDPAGTTSS
ncbi:MAG: response regulator transcription factor [Herbiconiux sp.]|nr:response regulator transcription factor [Herbiconiux sp.]